MAMTKIIIYIYVKPVFTHKKLQKVRLSLGFRVGGRRLYIYLFKFGNRRLARGVKIELYILSERP